MTLYFSCLDNYHILSEIKIFSLYDAKFWQNSEYLDFIALEISKSIFHKIGNEVCITTFLFFHNRHPPFLSSSCIHVIIQNIN